MKALPKIYLFLQIAVILSHCKKDVPLPNENWVAGRSWTDIRDGHTYTTIPIGNQIWMGENMAYLPSVNYVVDGSEVEGKEKDPFYYVYDFNGTDNSEAKAKSTFKQFGVLYNWTAALKACPVGWHLPTDSDWIDLELYLKMSPGEVILEGNRGTNEGIKIKSTWGWDFVIWDDRYGNGTNETGFTALPAGCRYQSQTVYPAEAVITGSGSSGFWWTATENNETRAWCRNLIYYSDIIFRYQDEKQEGMSVRCIKD